MIENEKEVLDFLGLPSIPKKEWDGHSSFKDAVVVLDLVGGRKAYAVATFDSAKDGAPRIKRVFGSEQFDGYSKIFVVPAYMDTTVDEMDLDEVSKQRARELVEEVKELQGETSEEESVIDGTNGDYMYEHIHNDEEAMAYIKSYNKRNRINGKVPTSHDEIVMRMAAIYAEETSKERKGKRKSRKN